MASAKEADQEANPSNGPTAEGSESLELEARTEPETHSYGDRTSKIPTSNNGTPKPVVPLLKRLATTRSNASVIDPGPPPDGGLKAWTQALMGHLMIFNTWGIISSYGVFQTYYTSTLHLTPTTVSWIGSAQMLLHNSVGLFSGRALDVGYFHWVVIPGVMLAALGMFLTSICSVSWQFFLAQGLLTGIGCGLQFTPSVSLVTTYFDKNRSLAIAIMASGSATGGLVYPALLREILPKLGLAWSVRVMGLMMCGFGALYCALLRPRLPPRRSGPLFELGAFRETPYTLYCVGIFLTIWGQFFAFYYISSFSQTVLHLPYSTSVNLLMAMNGIGLFGRIIPSFLADRFFGPYNTLIPFVFISGLILYFWSLVTTSAGLYAFALTYGLFSGGFQGLFPTVMGRLTKDLSRVGVRNGMGFAIGGVAAFTGPPIAGALVQAGGGGRHGYLVAQMWAGSVIMLGGLVLLFGRMSKTGWAWAVKV